MKTAFKVERLADIRNITLEEFLDRIRKAMANITKCDALDVVVANDPHKP